MGKNSFLLENYKIGIFAPNYLTYTAARNKILKKHTGE